MRGSSYSIMARVAFVAACLLVLGGCTPKQSREQYEERLGRAVEVRSSVVAKLDANQYVTPADYDAAATQVVSALDELEADPPPSAAKSAHERMVIGLEGLGTLLTRLGRCATLAERSPRDGRACRQSISQDVFDEIRNDFREADSIYLEEGFALPGIGGEEDGRGSDGSDTLDEGGGDEL